MVMTSICGIVPHILLNQSTMVARELEESRTPLGKWARTLQIMIWDVWHDWRIDGRGLSRLACTYFKIPALRGRIIGFTGVDGNEIKGAFKVDYQDKEHCPNAMSTRYVSLLLL